MPEIGNHSNTGRGMFASSLAVAVCGLAVSPLHHASRHLLQAADAVVGAASVLGENQRQEEEPGRLSAGGCALANAARDCEEAAGALFDERDWETTVDPLASASCQLATAALNLEHIGADAALQEAADELEEASTVTGCISLAAAAGPNLQAAGDALAAAGESFLAHGDGLRDGATAAHAEAGRRFAEAAAAMSSAGAAVRSTGEKLEAGKV